MKWGRFDCSQAFRERVVSQSPRGWPEKKRKILSLKGGVHFGGMELHTCMDDPNAFKMVNHLKSTYLK